MAAATSCSLRAKRLLLEPRFEGYKLSLEPLACYRLGLADGERRRCRRAATALLWPARPSPPRSDRAAAWRRDPSRSLGGHGAARTRWGLWGRPGLGVGRRDLGCCGSRRTGRCWRAQR